MATANIAGQVGGDTFAMGVALAAVDDPFLALGARDQLLGLETIYVDGKLETALIEKTVQRFDQPLADLVGEQLRGEQLVEPAVLPSAVGGDAAAGDQAMEVYVSPQAPRPGMEVHQQPGLGTEVLGVSEHLEKAEADALEEEVADELLVELPEDAQLGRQRAGEVEVVDGEQPLTNPVEPGVDLGPGAQRAGAVSAGVVPGLLDVAVGASLDVSAELGGLALTDGVGGLEMEEGQRAGSLVELEARLEDGAESEVRIHIGGRT